MSNLMESEVAHISCYHLLGLLNRFEDVAGRPGSIIVGFFFFILLFSSFQNFE